MTDRTQDLLRAAADALADCRDPFAHDWLVENEVTLDEVYSLSELMAIGTRLVAWGLDYPEQAIAAFNGARLQGAYEQLKAGLQRHVERCR